MIHTFSLLHQVQQQQQQPSSSLMIAMMRFLLLTHVFFLFLPYDYSERLGLSLTMRSGLLRLSQRFNSKLPCVVVYIYVSELTRRPRPFELMELIKSCKLLLLLVGWPLLLSVCT